MVCDVNAELGEGLALHAMGGSCFSAVVQVSARAVIVNLSNTVRALEGNLLAVDANSFHVNELHLYIH